MIMKTDKEFAKMMEDMLIKLADVGITNNRDECPVCERLYGGHKDDCMWVAALTEMKEQGLITFWID